MFKFTESSYLFLYSILLFLGSVFLIIDSILIIHLSILLLCWRRWVRSGEMFIFSAKTQINENKIPLYSGRIVFGL